MWQTFLNNWGCTSTCIAPVAAVAAHASFLSIFFIIFLSLGFSLSTGRGVPAFRSGGSYRDSWNLSQVQTIWSSNLALFHGNTKLLGLGRQFGQTNFGGFGVLSADSSAPIFVMWVPCPCFPIINHYFYKKLSLYIQISNIYLNLGRKELGI